MLHPTHDATLVALSILIAALASYVALTLAGPLSSAAGSRRVGWLAGGSFAMGIGIWSMHFVAMLAFRLPVPVAYDVPLLTLSVAIAIGASLLALAVGPASVGSPAFLVAGISMGTAIAGMHYTGMAAMRLPAQMRYDPPLVVLSVAIAIAASLIALRLSFRQRGDEARVAGCRKVGGAAGMGGALAGVHYTAMAAARFTAAPEGAAHDMPPSALLL